MPWLGCVGQAPLRAPAAKSPEQALDAQRKAVLAHLLGSWELPGREGKIKQMIFEPAGQLTFRGGLEFFNPGQWQLDAEGQELQITLPQTPDEQLDIFRLYVGDAVKAFDRARKQVTYRFNAETWQLNVAGWIYSKPDQPAVHSEADPVFK